MRRRNFITLIGGAAAWPVAAQAQPSVIPVIGLVNVGTPIDSLTEAFRQGLAELGYIEGRNVVIDYRNADNRYERLPELVTELAGGMVIATIDYRVTLTLVPYPAVPIVLHDLATSPRAVRATGRFRELFQLPDAV